MLDSWAAACRPEIRGVIKTQVDHSDGEHVGVRPLRSNECTNSTLAPLMKFDASGKFRRDRRRPVCGFACALHRSRRNVWAGVEVAKNGKGADLIKFSGWQGADDDWQAQDAGRAQAI